MAAENSPKTSGPASAEGVLLKPEVYPGRPMCRICHAGSGRERLLKPCDCRGSVQFVHRSCLQQFRGPIKEVDACEMCRGQYQTVRVPKSCCEWIRRDRETCRGMTGCLALFLITLGLLLYTWQLAVNAAVDHKQTNRSIGMIIAGVCIAVAFSIGFLAATGYICGHYYKEWRRWRASNYRVRLQDRQSLTTSRPTGRSV